MTVKNIDGEYVEITSCTLTDPATTTCAIEMTDLALLTGLQEGDLIVVQVTATNAKSTSDLSEENTTGSTLNGDIAPDMIINVQTTANGLYVDITWDVPAENLAPITEYDVQIQKANGNFNSETTYCGPTSSQVLTNTT